jgi:exopolyphosphatase/guanosine-5'-triphosphate,3'-diphosphate pyrophosphatase
MLGAVVRCACIDIGSNTTRLLVADVADGVIAPVAEQRAFTRLGRACADGAALPAEALAALGQVVAEQVAAANAHGAGTLRIVATAALRRAVNRDEACAALAGASGVAVELLSETEEAQLAFAGATGALAPLGVERVAVLDVGGASTQFAVGRPGADVEWSTSLALGSGDLAAACLHRDPPAAEELDAARERVAAALAQLEIPPCSRTFAVGGSATSLRRLVGPVLDRAQLAGALAALNGAPAAVVAERTEIAPERVRLLRAGVLVLDAAVAMLGPLAIAGGGLREGIVRELASR